MLGHGALSEFPFSTIAVSTVIPDTTPPILSNPTISSVTASGGTPAVTTNESGGICYMVVVPEGDNPSVVQIKTGKRSDGTAALASETKPVTAIGTQTFSTLSNLWDGLPYSVYFVHTDASLNDSIPVTVTFSSSGTNTQVVPLANYSIATAIPEQLIPDNATAMVFEIPRNTSFGTSIWTGANTTIDVMFEANLNDGNGWVSAGGFGAYGGTYIRRDGSEARKSSIRIPLPPGVGRKVRGVMTPSTTIKTACEYLAVVPVAGFYTTNFLGTENPISEGGVWQNNGINWAQVKTVGGFACGTQTGFGGYNDSYAHLTGFSPNHKITGIVRFGPGWNISNAQEIELHLRATSSPNFTSLYECMIVNQQSALANVTIARWNGPFENITVLTTTEINNLPEIVTGDSFEAKIQGNLISVSVNGILRYTATDNTLTTGNPGFGFFQREFGANEDTGFSSITATDI